MVVQNEMFWDSKGINMAKKVESLDSLLEGIKKDVYVKYFQIELCGTVDDTSHEITYTRYKNSGMLKVINSTLPINFRRSNVEFYEINGTKLVIKDTKSFDKEILKFLKSCNETPISVNKMLGTWYVIKVELSHGKKYRFETLVDNLHTISSVLYKYLSNYQDIVLLNSRVLYDKPNRNEIKL